MDVRTVEQFIIDHFESWGEAEYVLSWDKESEDIPGLGNVRSVENVGGEGEGEHRHLVLLVTFEDGSQQHYRLDGYYQSYDGTEWDGELYEVRPVQRLVIFYEA